MAVVERRWILSSVMWRETKPTRFGLGEARRDPGQPLAPNPSCCCCYYHGKHKPFFLFVCARNQCCVTAMCCPLVAMCACSGGLQQEHQRQMENADVYAWKEVDSIQENTRKCSWWDVEGVTDEKT
ncbi:hypothetical protein E2C01_078966 [Portunus trituberculatus]|uniref:Uncharacterized protein n=1 Tax=Portunus trituberculatus TaxID=210409 RepID=A0A5B7IRL8_PORTR|nr:hypothetical protein [Portunus trituberculatus]